GRARDPGGRRRALREAVVGFERGELLPDRLGGLESGAELAARQPAGVDIRSLPARLEDEGAREGGESGGVEPVPDPAAQAFGDEEVALPVDAHERAAGLGDL